MRKQASRCNNKLNNIITIITIGCQNNHHLQSTNGRDMESRLPQRKIMDLPVLLASLGCLIQLLDPKGQS
jgi:hypothetical protein